MHELCIVLQNCEGRIRDIEDATFLEVFGFWEIFQWDSQSSSWFGRLDVNLVGC